MAWEPTEALPEPSIKYTVKPKVDSSSTPDPGRYGKPEKIRPAFGSITTDFH